MNTSTAILGILVLAVLIVMILFVTFGQVTVRKLRKNPATKDALGMELMSGWAIINVAQALAMPASVIRKFKRTQLSFLYASVDVLEKHTNKFDKLLAACFYWSLMATGLSTIAWTICVSLGWLN